MSDIGLTETVKDNPCKFEVWLQGRNEVHVLQVCVKKTAYKDSYSVSVTSFRKIFAISLLKDS